MATRNQPEPGRRAVYAGGRLIREDGAAAQPRATVDAAAQLNRAADNLIATVLTAWAEAIRRAADALDAELATFVDSLDADSEPDDGAGAIAPFVTVVMLTDGTPARYEARPYVDSAGGLTLHGKDREVITFYDPGEWRSVTTHAAPI